MVADIRCLPFRPFRVRLLWMSFPCDEFAKFGMRCFYPSPPAPDLSCAIAARGILDAWRPDAWVVENVRSSMRFLNPLFGMPVAVTSGHVFWSSVALFPQLQPRKSKVGEQRGEWLRKLKRAIIPYEVGAGLAAILEVQ